MAAIIDASVALKWVFEEPGSPAARSLLAEQTLAAPDLLLAECGNILWDRARRGLIGPDDARAAFAAIEAAPVRMIPARPLVLRAQEIAIELERPLYATLHLAAALAERAVLVTANPGFLSAVQAHPVYRDAVRRL